MATVSSGRNDMLLKLSKVGLAGHILVNLSLVLFFSGQVYGWNWTSLLVLPEGGQRYWRFHIYFYMALAFAGIGFAYISLALRRLQGAGLLCVAHLLLAAFQVVVCCVALT